MKIKPGLEEAYKKYIHISNPDDDMSGYVQGIIDYAELWAGLMETAIDNGESVDQCAERTSHEADTQGITGNMYGNAAHILASFWMYGDQLKLWHNTKWGNPNAKGTINPAILCIGVKE